MKLLVATLFLLLFLPARSFPAELGTARVSLIKGDVQVYTEDTANWVAASINMPLLEGDRLWSPEGARNEIQVLGGIYVRLDGSTALDVLALEEDALQFYAAEGRLYINNMRGGPGHIQIDTPLTSISSYGDSIIMIDVAGDGTTDLSVIKGYADAETLNGGVRIDAGNAIHIEQNVAAELAPLSEPDKWERWNHKRDQKLAEAGESLRYLPDDLDEYAHDFGAYGRWVYTNEYGYCWTPTVGIPIDWSPYRVGRWVWCRGNYVWISSEPWGWAPYHYGRWAFVAGTGWCWVPPPRNAVYWAPGYVGWVYTPTYVAWVPLAPGETYYGRGYFGPHSVNITTVNMSTINVNTIVYRNTNVGNGITVVNRTTFVSGEKVRPVALKENPFRALGRTPSAAIGPPAIKPERRAALPAIRKIPAAARPPERVRSIKPAQIREERRLRKSEGESAFRPGRPAATMPVQERKTPRQPPSAGPAVKKAPAVRGGESIRSPAAQPRQPAAQPRPPAVEQKPAKERRQPPAQQPAIQRQAPAARPPAAEQRPPAERRQAPEGRPPAGKQRPPAEEQQPAGRERPPESPGIPQKHAPAFEQRPQPRRPPVEAPGEERPAGTPSQPQEERER